VAGSRDSTGRRGVAAVAAIIEEKCDTRPYLGVLSGVTAKALDGAFPGDAAWRAVRAEGDTPRTSLMSDTPPNTSIDPTLPLRAKAGDRQAFAQLVDVLYPRSLRFALHMVGNREDAEEAVQDAFIRIYHNLGRFRDDARFEPWLFRILANRCRSLMEKRRRHSVLIQYGELPERFSAAPEGETRDVTEEIYRILATLPVEQREAFLLRHVEDMAYEDIAAVTGVGLSALRMRVKRACDVLRARLSEVMRDD
jgi:RNA polymerase sigma-70 factor (ECF subfamily)